MIQYHIIISYVPGVHSRKFDNTHTHHTTHTHTRQFDINIKPVYMMISYDDITNTVYIF